MVDFKITKIKSRWILDSRGNPTVETDVYSGDLIGRAAVPSGASTGVLEALELRDDGKDFMGKHVTKAVANVNNIIAKKLIGYDVREQVKIDEEMISLDGTENKSELGANAILSVSLANAKLAAILSSKPLFSYLYELSYNKRRKDFLLPLPCCNILNGGEHAGNNLSIQEFMILPVGANTFSKAIKSVSEIYHNLKNILEKKYGKTAVNVGDEGGFAPNMSNTREALDAIIEAIEKASYERGIYFQIGLDAAASEFYKEDLYYIDGKKLTGDNLTEYYLELLKEYPLIKSIEDPFDEKDFKHFSELTNKVDDSIQIVDDDLTVTNIDILERAIEEKAGNALLLKVNQIGSLTEAIKAAKMAFENGFNVMVSHRSGETEDTFIADLAVGLCSGQIKSGATCRSDRCAKYNQILRIEEFLGGNANYPKKFDSWKNYQ
ncbi:MAG: phosphopyruvate hydratase [Candidatus Lokiarchaeota archaeon]|nr:phosphopyruvate hydratase [Candidatus Lokiarchaeota archaeon]MBD3339239.1 phosphopyruvate hydratase [Candidatus Lokiarchaeota archaeon]